MSERAKTVRELLESQEDWPDLRSDAGTRRYANWILNALGPILDATVYRFCPECGGSRVLATGPPLNIGEPCSACADAPTAIVSAALREKVKAAFREVKKYQQHKEMTDSEAVDLLLSTVLGQVRYAKEIGRWHDYYPGHIETGNAGRQTRDFVSLRSGDAIAILEEAGKEE